MLERIASVMRRHAQKGGHGLLPRLATAADYREFNVWLRSQSPQPVKSDAGREYLAEVERSGICIVKNYWSADECEQGRREVDRVIAEYPAYVNGNAKADVRVYGANNASPTIDRFAQDEMLASLATAYNRERTRTAFTLAARMPATEGNNGSGEGWHRDAFLRQIKAILYLSDVGPENGPFQLVRDSHRKARVIGDMKSAGLAYKQYRVSEDQVDRIVAQEPDRLLTYTAQVGTLILVDTSSLHRGQPIEAGCRYALTNYYFPEDRIERSLYDKFDVLPRAAAT